MRNNLKRLPNEEKESKRVLETLFFWVLPLLPHNAKMIADKGKKAKLSEKPEDDNSEVIDEKLVISIEKLQEIQDELEKVLIHSMLL